MYFKNIYEVLDYKNIVSHGMVYGLNNALRISGFPMRLTHNDDENPIKAFNRGKNLGNKDSISAEDNYLCGIVVQFDLSIPNKMWTEFQRYHFADIISSHSTMHRISQIISAVILLPAVASGLLATAVLNINNLRDIEQDRKAGKNTLAVRLGPHNGRVYHCLLLSIAALFYLLFALMNLRNPLSFVFLLTYPLLFKHAYFVFSHKEPVALRPMLAQMSLIALLINGLFSFGLLLG